MDDKAAVTRVLTDYFNAFSTLDVQAIVSYYHEPSLFINSQGVIAAPTHAAMTDGLTSVAEDLRARGYRRSELSMLHVTQLSATATLAGGVAVRYKANGQELERVGVTYLLHRADSRWRIAVVVTHDTDAVVRPE